MTQSLNTVGRINPKQQAMALHTENKAHKSYVICVFGVRKPSSGQLPASPSTHLQAWPIQAELVGASLVALKLLTVPLLTQPSEY